MRPRGGKRERERDCGEQGEKGNYSGDIDPAATRQPFSLDSLGSARLRLTYTRLHSVYLFTSPSPPAFSLLFTTRAVSSSTSYFSSFSSSSSLPSPGPPPPSPPLLLRAVQPSSLLDRRTRKRQERLDVAARDHEGGLRRRCTLYVVSMKRDLSPRVMSVTKFVLVGCFLACALWTCLPRSAAATLRDV